MATVFISYSSKDRTFVERLAADLKALRRRVWLDRWEIRVGESIPDKIGRALETADLLAVVLSKNGANSGWVEREWQTKYWDEVNHKKVIVLPIRIDNSPVPTLLRTKKWADFRTSYEAGLAELETAILTSDRSGIVRTYSDFVDISDEWIPLFQESERLDLLMMYSDTWRNTYLKHIRGMLGRKGGRLRVVLPDVLGNKPLRDLYSARLGKRPDELRARVSNAIEDFHRELPQSRLAVYVTSLYLTHAMYLFDAAGILALYGYETSRAPTPAFYLKDGDLLDFMRRDFEWLVEPSHQFCRQLTPAVRAGSRK